MHTSIQGVSYGFRSPWTGIIFSLVLKGQRPRVSLGLPLTTEQVSPDLQPQFSYRCSLQLRGSHLTSDKLGLRRSKSPAWSVLEASQWELGNQLPQLILQCTAAFSLWSLPWLSGRPLKEPAVPNLFTLLLQSLKVPPRLCLWSSLSYTAHPHAYTGNCNPLQACVWHQLV